MKTFAEIPEHTHGFPDPDFDSGWFMSVQQVIKIKHDLNTKDFKLAVLYGSDDINGTFPAWAMSVTGSGKHSAGNIIMATKVDEITVARCADGSMMVDPSIVWSNAFANFIRVKLWV